MPMIAFSFLPFMIISLPDATYNRFELFCQQEIPTGYNTVAGGTFPYILFQPMQILIFPVANLLLIY